MPRKLPRLYFPFKKTQRKSRVTTEKLTHSHLEIASSNPDDAKAIHGPNPREQSWPRSQGGKKNQRKHT